MQGFSLRFEKTLFVLWLCFLFVYALRPLQDFDTFWQLQSGRFMWEMKSVIDRDVFSLAADLYRVEHCWLSDLLFFALYKAGGYQLLALLKPAVVALCGAWLFRWNARNGVDVSVLLPVLLLCFAASADSWLVRPQLWTFLFALLFLHLLFRGREEGWRALRWLPLLMVAWANLHAGCLFGLALVGLFTAGESVLFLQGKIPAGRLRRMLCAGVLTLAASFVNPYGYRIPLMLLDYVNLHAVTDITKLGNMEWLSPTPEQTPLFYLVMALWSLALLPRLRHKDPVEIVLFLAFGYMGFSQIRHTTLVALLAGYFLPATAAQGLRALPRFRTIFGRGRPVLLGAAAVLALGLLAGQIRNNSLGFGLKKSTYPVAAADFILEKQLPANLFNFYDWGGYLMWRLYPRYQVFVDGRSISPEMFEAFTRVANGMDGWSDVLDAHQVNTVVTKSCFFDTGGPVPLVDNLARDPGWALVFAEGHALVFVRKRAEFARLWKDALSPDLAYEVMLREAGKLFAEDRSRSRALLAMARASFRLGHLSDSKNYYSLFLTRCPESAEAQKMCTLLSRNP